MDRNALSALLREHRAGDEREQNYLARILALVEESAHPFERSQFEPGHVTASAFVLSPDRTQILLIHHSKLNLWLQPGGHTELSDADIIAAARREVEEETGITETTLEEGYPVLLDVDIHEIPPNKKRGEPAHEHFDVRVLFRATTMAFSAGSDALAARWVDLENVEDAGTDDSVRRAVRKLLERKR